MARQPGTFAERVAVPADLLAPVPDGVDLAHVAAGRYDGFWESGLQPWDVAAGILLVREAGGFVTDFRGGDQPIERKEIIAGNDAMHSKLHKLVAGALR